MAGVGGGRLWRSRGMKTCGVLAGSVALVAVFAGALGGSSAAAPVPSVSIDDVALPEGDSGNTDFVFTVTLSAPSAKSVKVAYQAVNGSATLGSDFNPSQGSLSFDPGETSQTVTVVVRGDADFEPNETFFVNLSNARFATIADGEGQGTIVNDDGPVTGLSIDDVTVGEGDSGTRPATFTVKLSSPAASDVTFDIATRDNTASAPSDYAARSVNGATIAAGQQTFTFTVDIVGDTVPEPDESFFVDISNPDGAAIADGQGIGTIINDDGAGGGNLPSLSVSDPSLPEGDSGTTAFDFTVTLSKASQQQVKVDYATANGTATALSDYQPTNGQLIFKKGETSKTIEVLVYGDTLPEVDETFFVNLSNSQNATLAQGQAVGTVENDDDQPPTAAGQSQTTLEDNALRLTLSGGDPEGANVAFSIASGPSHGSLGALGTPSCSGTPSTCTATVTYSPETNYNGSDSFTFTTNDGFLDSAPATVSISVTAVNDAPSFSLPASPDQSLNNDAGAQTVTGFATGISAGPSDESGQTLTFHVSNDDTSLFSAQPAIDPSSGDLTYTPSASTHGAATVSVYLTDSGGTANGGADTSGTQTFQVSTIQPDRAPTADAQSSVTTDEDTAKAITLTGGDADGDTLSFSIVGDPLHGSLGTIGTVSCDGGTPSSCSADVTYTPNPNYNGSDSFTFKTNDGTVDSGSNATVSITVNAVDDPPVAVDDSTSLLEDAAATTIGVLANDTDVDGGPKMIGSKTNGTHGTVVITNAGSDLTYQPDANYCGSDSFTYTLNGGDSATVEVTVTCVNDAPSFTKGPDETSLDNQDADGSAKAYAFPGWATDISAGPPNESTQTLTFAVAADDTSLFTVQPAIDASTGDLTFTTDPTASGSTTVTVTLQDNGGTADNGVDTSAQQTFTISTVVPPPQGPLQVSIHVDDSTVPLPPSGPAPAMEGSLDHVLYADVTNAPAAGVTYKWLITTPNTVGWMVDPDDTSSSLRILSNTIPDFVPETTTAQVTVTPNDGSPPVTASGRFVYSSALTVSMATSVQALGPQVSPQASATSIPLSGSLTITQDVKLPECSAGIIGTITYSSGGVVLGSNTGGDPPIVGDTSTPPTEPFVVQGSTLGVGSHTITVNYAIWNCLAWYPYSIDVPIQVTQ